MSTCSPPCQNDYIIFFPIVRKFRIGVIHRHSIVNSESLDHRFNFNCIKIQDYYQISHDLTLAIDPLHRKILEMTENKSVTKNVRLEITPNLSAEDNMARDRQALMSGDAVLRFYSWQPAAISLGISENINEIIDLDLCKKHNIDLVKRVTGGAAVLHKNDATYSLIMPRDYWPETSVHAIYDLIAEALCLSLDSLGIKTTRADTGSWSMPTSHVCFEGPAKNEILVNGRKICGSAQSHKRKAILQHGSIPLINHTTLLCNLLKINDDETIDRINKQCISVEEASGKELAAEEIFSALQIHFSHVLAKQKIKIVK